MATKFYKGRKPLLSQPSIGGGLLGRAYIGGEIAYGTLPFSNGLLDLYPTAYAAWSLRRLSSTYSGAAIEVTRTSDSATQDIGFDGETENLDTNALATFAGSNTCVVSIWYDQSGNSRDISIPSAKRPTIVSSGTLQTLNGGKATMKPQTGQLGVDTGLTGLTDKTIFFAGDSTNQLGNAVSRLFSGYAGTGALGDNFLLDHVTGGSGYVRYFDGGVSVNSQTQVDGEVVIGGYTDGGNIGVRINNTTTQTNTGASPNNTQNYHLFEDGGGGINNEIPTFASEYIIYDSAKDSDLTDIMTNIDGYYSITPPSPDPILTDLVFYGDAGNTSSYPGSGNTWTDLSGEGNDGTLSNVGFTSTNGGGLTWVDDTTFRKVTLPSQLMTGDFTISFFFTYEQPTNEGWMYSQYTGGDAGRSIFNTEFDDTIRGFYSGTSLQTTTTLTEDTVNYVTWVRSGNTGKIYINSGTPDTTGTVNTANMTNTAGVIGARADGGANQGFIGTIYIAMFYDTALTDEQIGTNYDAFKDRFGL